MLKLILLLALLLSSSQSYEDIENTNLISHRSTLFQIFQKQFNKIYQSDAEMINRFSIFQNNLETIFQNEEKDTKAKYGTTIFSDLSPEEFKQKYLNLNIKNINEQEIPQQQDEISMGLFDYLYSPSQQKKELPKNFDWRDHGAVTPVKHQQSCGSCWAFTTAAILESQYAIKHGKQVDLSEQQLLDCDQYNSGCDGGLMTTAYKFMTQNDMGIMLTEDYGEYLDDVGRCHYDDNKSVAKILNYFQLKKDEKIIQDELYRNGPLAVGINASYLQFFDGGVLDHPDCDDEINHAVLLVGWGVDENTGAKYWLLKNQWGERWGDKGYFRLARDKQRCGIHSYASIVFIE